MSELAVQAIGFVGVAFFIASYQIKSNKALFMCQMIGCIIFCVQFFIMGAYTGAVSLIINIIRNLLLVKRNDWKWVDRKSTMLVILALLTAMTVYTWAVHHGSGYHHRLLEQQCPEDKTVTVYWLSVRTVV